MTCVLVWSKSDQRRLRKTLHKQTDKQTDTTKIMVTWPWTNMDKFEKTCSYKISVPQGNVWQSNSWWYAYYIGRQCPSIQRSEKLATKFKRGRNSVEDEHHSGCCKDAASTENVQIVNDMLKEDRCLTVQHIAETTAIHGTAVYRIVSDDLGMKKVSARWVPRMLVD